MTLEVGPRPLDERISRLATAQGGIVGRSQLLELGLGEDGIATRLRVGRLALVQRGTYVVGHRAWARNSHLFAALLALGEAAALSHWTSAAQWLMCEPRSGPIHLTLTHRSGRVHREGAVVHRPRMLADHEIGERGGFPVTTVARTLVDLAAIATARELEKALDEAEYQRIVDLPSLLRTIEEVPSRRGMAVLRRLLAERGAGLVFTRSELERMFLDLCRPLPVDMPRANAWIVPDAEGGMEVDFLWPDRRLVVEVDGFQAHGTPAALNRDHRRDRRLRAAGYEPVRFTWSDLTHHRRRSKHELMTFYSSNAPRADFKGV